MIKEFIICLVIGFSCNSNASYVEDHLEIELDRNTLIKVSFYSDLYHAYGQALIKTLYGYDSGEDLAFESYIDSFDESYCSSSAEELKCDFNFKSILPDCVFDKDQQNNCFDLRYPLIIKDLNMKFSIKFSAQKFRHVKSLNIELTNSKGQKIVRELDGHVYSYKQIIED